GPGTGARAQDESGQQEGGGNAADYGVAQARPAANGDHAAAVPERLQQMLQPLDLRIGHARLVPQIVAHARLRARASRSKCMPRCRFTRTEPSVRPVRSEISGPLMPSTRRRTRVSRYASGSF